MARFDRAPMWSKWDSASFPRSRSSFSICRPENDILNFFVASCTEGNCKLLYFVALARHRICEREKMNKNSFSLPWLRYRTNESTKDQRKKIAANVDGWYIWAWVYLYAFFPAIHRNGMLTREMKGMTRKILHFFSHCHRFRHTVIASGDLRPNVNI